MNRHVLMVLPTVFAAHGGIPRFNQLLCRAVDELAPELGLSGEVLGLGDRPEGVEAARAAWNALEFQPCRRKADAVRNSLAASLRHRPTMLLVGHLGMAPIGALCGPLVERGWGLIVHGTEAWVRPRRSRRWAARRARFVFAVSRHTGERFCEAARIDPGHVRLLPNALEPGFEQEGIGEEAPGPEILSVARLWAREGQKGIDHVLEAVARLGQRHAGLVYRIVGRGDDRPRLEARARQLGIADRVIFEQDLTDLELAERYRQCAVFVLPSGQEGFGIVFLEAMRFARSCIGGEAGGTPEVVVDGETGLLVPYGQTMALADALDRLLSDAGLRKRMGEAGRRRLDRHFSFERMKERVGRYLVEWLETAAD